MADVEQMSRRYVLRRHLAEIERVHGDRWTQTPKRARLSRSILNGDQPAPIPEQFAKGIDASSFRVDLPHKYLVPYHQRNTLSRNPPYVERLTFGDSVPKKTEATRIENAIQAVMDAKYPFRDTVDYLQNEAWCLTIAMPATASMARLPSLLDDKKRIRPAFERDKDGRTRSEAGKGFTVSKTASKKAHAETVRAQQAQDIPVFVEAMGPTSVIPVIGPGNTLDYAIVKRVWTETEVIRRRWVWDGMPHHLSPAGSAIDGYREDATNGTVEVTEFYATDWVDSDDEDERGCHPYVAYFVDGKPIRKHGDDGSEADALIDLRKEYGMTRLPAVMKWGISWAHPDYDKKAMPFILPFAQAYLAVDAILTAAVAFNWLRGFPILVRRIKQDQPDLERMADAPDEDDNTDPLTPFSVLTLAAEEVTELGAKGIAPDFYRTVELMLASNREEGPPNAAFGGGGESGFQASLAKAYADEALDDLKDAALELYAETASIILEILTGLARKHGPIPIKRMVPVPVGAKRGSRPQYDIAEISAELAHGYYDLSAQWPPTPNLARGQQLAEWALAPNPLVLEDEFREQVMGDRNPEVYQAKKYLQMARNSPKFLELMMGLAMKRLGEEDEAAQLASLGQQQAIQDAEGGVWPGAVTVGLEGPGGMVPGMPQLQQAQTPVPLTGAGGLPSAGGSALGGAIGGQMAAPLAAAQAGGIVPPELPIGGM